MRKRKPKQSPELKTFRVGYFLEQGFAINVRARSEREAERSIRKRLDDECGELELSTRVHYDDGIASVSEVRS
jgi:hypothetical protein